MSWEVFRCQTNCTAAPHACINAELYTEMSTALAKDGYLEAGYKTVSIECAASGFALPPACPSLTPLVAPPQRLLGGQRSGPRRLGSAGAEP